MDLGSRCRSRLGSWNYQSPLVEIHGGLSQPEYYIPQAWLFRHFELGLSQPIPDALSVRERIGTATAKPTGEPFYHCRLPRPISIQQNRTLSKRTGENATGVA